jgi:hypothetical protein
VIKDINRAYCAGLFEGEGTIHSSIRNKSGGSSRQRSIAISITMSDVMPLELFGDIVGAGTIRGPFSSKYGNKLMYEYRTNKFETVQFIICNIWDWLSPRRKEQCVKAINNYTSFKLSGPAYSLKRNNRGDYR